MMMKRGRRRDAEAARRKKCDEDNVLRHKIINLIEESRKQNPYYWRVTIF